MVGGRAEEGRAATRVLAAVICLLTALGVGAAVGQARRGAPPAPSPIRDAAPLPAAPSNVAGPAGRVEKPVAEPTQNESLKSALDEVWRLTPDGCLTVSDGNRVLYEVNGANAVAPASAIKVLTATAALDILGRDAVLRTQVRSYAPDAAGRVLGDLWLVGAGDPLLGTARWAEATGRQDAFTSLETLADRVVAAGVKAVEGRVVGDESRYDTSRFVDSWPERFLDDGEAGPLSALTANAGFRVWGHPGTPFDNPPLGAAELLAELLVQRGVAVGGVAAGEAPPETMEVASIESAPIGKLVQKMLRDSENGVAELLVKEIGLKSSGTGSTAGGVRAVRASLERRGLPTTGSTIADGSGLSDADRVSCQLLTSVVATGPQDLISGLPVAARDGTLERRFTGTPVAGRLRAKTGSLDGVASLTGIVRTQADNTLSFAYIVNGLPHDDSGRRLQDALATALVTAG